MDLKLIIERAEAVAGSQKALAIKIGQSEGNIRAAKSGARGLPNYACLIIAELIGEDETTVLAASELVTEKKPERRAFWEKKLERLAAMVLLGVISVVTPTPSNAAPVLQVHDLTLYIMSNDVLVTCQDIMRNYVLLKFTPPPCCAPLDGMTTIPEGVT